MKFFVYVLFAAIGSSAPVSAAVEQCRLIQAKADRAACYGRRDCALAAKRASSAASSAKTFEPVESIDDTGRRRAEAKPAEHLPGMLGCGQPERWRRR
jgi:hypothetical protein